MGMIQAIPPLYRNPLISNSAGVEAGQTQVADRLAQGIRLKEAEHQEIRNHEDDGNGYRNSDEAVKHLEPGSHQVVEELPSNPNQEEPRHKRKRKTYSTAAEAEQALQSSSETESQPPREPVGGSLTLGNQEQLRAVAKSFYSQYSSAQTKAENPTVDLEG
jgi:hypothetical protein